MSAFHFLSAALTEQATLPGHGLPHVGLDADLWFGDDDSGLGYYGNDEGTNFGVPCETTTRTEDDAGRYAAIEEISSGLACVP